MFQNGFSPKAVQPEVPGVRRDPKGNLKVFCHEATFQFTVKCRKVEFLKFCKTKSRQSSRQCLRMVRAIPPGHPQTSPISTGIVKKTVFVKNSIFHFFRCFVPYWIAVLLKSVTRLGSTRAANHADLPCRGTPNPSGPLTHRTEPDIFLAKSHFRIDHN